jgi:hypothetical protein
VKTAQADSGPAATGTHVDHDDLIYLVTSADQPALCDDDQVLRSALESAGMRAQVVVWTDAAVDWSKAAVCMVRSVWDYHLQPEHFREWMTSVDAMTTLLNPRDLMTWNLHKRYLRELSSYGIPIIDTVWMRRGTSVELDAILSRRHWDEALVKPAVSASSWKTAKVVVGDPTGQSLVNDILQSTDVMVQPYLRSIERDGEVSVIAIEGEVTHAARRVSALTNDISVTRQGAAHTMTADEGRLAREVTALLPETPLYARIDIVRDDHDLAVLGELELIEPVLYLRHSSTAAARLCTALRTYIDNASSRAPRSEAGDGHRLRWPGAHSRRPQWVNP